MTRKTRIVRTYVVAADPYDGWAKIGRTEGNVRHRLDELQTGNPRPLRCVALWRTEMWPGTALIDVEATLHEHFALLRGVGEWFALPSALLMEMATSDRDRQQGYLEVMERWPASRVLALGPGPAPAPSVLASTFAAPPTRHDLATTKLRSVPFAG